ncbi:MAG TPA: Fe-S cluster assembly protein SufD [Cyclobacteriaceae bacterium]|nr:Fe-S cluster assembly protein SufD [Cyclobacteriaceae bacterium]
MSLINVGKNISDNILHQLESHVDAFPVLSEIRRQTFATFQQCGLPGNKHEEYRFTPLTKAVEKFDFSPLKNETRNSPGDVMDFLIPNADTHSLVFIDGTYQPALSSAREVPGLTIGLLDEVVRKSPGVIEPYLSSFSEASHDPFTAWNILGWQSGLFISLDKNITLDKPLAIYHLVDAKSAPAVILTRNLIVVGKNSNLRIIHKINSRGNLPHFVNTVTEAIVHENAGLDYYSVQDDAGEHYEFNRTHIAQSNSSRVNTFTISLNGKIVRNNLQLSLNGEGCESHMYGLYLLQGDTLVDNHSVADHQKPNSFSNELYKGIIDDRARGVFNGKIYVRPNAQKTNAFQSNRNILLSDSARINTKPQLEIWADDVKCSHGCTSGQLDEEALFYLQTRGISKSNAQAMLLYAFAGEVINTITIPAVREYLEKVIRTRLHQTQ